MKFLHSEATWRKWVNHVRDCLRATGYYYEPGFCSETDEPHPIVTAAKLLGPLYVPPDTKPDKPVILTQPSPSAPEWRPFDRRGSIGWHNDFSTRVRRPELSLSWVRREDPGGTNGGAWKVASATNVVSHLSLNREGKRLVANLLKHAEPFGYVDAGGWRSFRVISKKNRCSGYHEVRFYGRALQDGARLRFGQVPERTREIIARVVEAAESVSQVLPASKGSLLVVDNRLSLHDRLEQQVTGPVEHRRQAWLCFVRRLHQPL
jgi:Taurine catabolism dioxygenase TauD, TfdA family